MHDLTPLELARFADYLGNALPPEEVEAVERWIAEHPDQQTLVAYLRQPERAPDIHTLATSPERIARLDAVSRFVAEQIHLEQESALKHDQFEVKRMGGTRAVDVRRLQRTRFQAVWYGVSGIIAAILFIVAGWKFGLPPREPATTIPMSTYATSNGERATVTLPDGSTILLNVASRVQVPTSYSAKDRTVYLTGEALFTVSHRDGAPFTVIAGPSTTRVLGTSFLVRHYPTDSVATVAVRDGKVAVDSIVLTAAQQVTVGWTVRSHVRAVDPTQFSFATGVLTLQRTTLAEAIPMLSRWYDVDIRLADASLASRRITGEFGTGSVADLVAIVTTAFQGIDIVRDGRTVTLYRR